MVIIDFKKGFEILEVLKISLSECVHFLDIFGATHDHLLTNECKYVNLQLIKGSYEFSKTFFPLMLIFEFDYLCSEHWNLLSFSF